MTGSPFLSLERLKLNKTEIPISVFEYLYSAGTFQSYHIFLKVTMLTIFFIAL
jgi:hypothetical protein